MKQLGMIRKGATREAKHVPAGEATARFRGSESPNEHEDGIIVAASSGSTN